MRAATSTRISPIFRCQLVMSLDVAHHSSPCRGSAFSQRRLTSSRCSCREAGAPEQGPPAPAARPPLGSGQPLCLGSRPDEALPRG